jgi:hypothetical protein
LIQAFQEATILAAGSFLDIYAFGKLSQSGSSQLPAGAGLIRGSYSNFTRFRSSSELSGEVADNFKRFIKSLPANAKNNVTIQAFDDGSYLFTGKSPGRVPGSYALYQKGVNAEGKTVSAVKTTIDPEGVVVSVKDKLK